MKLNTNQTPWRNSLVLWLLVGAALVYSFYALFENILMPFIVAMIIAYILKPIVEKLATVKFSRALSATLLVGGFILMVIAASMFAIPLVKNELLSFSHKLPMQIKLLEDAIAPYSPPEIFQRRSQKFNMAHGLTIIQQHDDFCDFFGFSTEPGNSQINNFYLDQKELFSKFVQDFYETLSADLESLEKYRFYIPGDVSKQKKQVLELTNRQRECGVLISQGYSAKEIARTLNLSPRTVEYYLDNLRQRVGAKNRTHLCSIIRYFV